MSKIQLLDQNTINKIAAGEVVERPASIVKELVENSIDAKATAITVEIKEGGLSTIRITDNGIGIDASDISNAFLRHSTSKIKNIEDLITVSSLGFRGEALASIASVSQVEMITKTYDHLTGIRYLIEGGFEKSIEEIGCPEGTTFIINNMFYNTPVRRKFLKAPITEAAYVSDLMNKLALGNPQVSFKFINNNQIKLHTSGNNQLQDCIFTVFGKDIAKNLIELNELNGDFHIRGYIGKPVISRANRSYENYYINGRYIKSKVIQKAIEDAYKSKLTIHQYPFTVFNIEILSEYIDVNVHPTKMDIRFNNEQEIYDVLYSALTKALVSSELIPEVTFDKRKEQPKPIIGRSIPEPFEANRLQGNSSNFTKDFSKIQPINNSVSEASKQYSSLKESILLKDSSNINENNRSMGIPNIVQRVNIPEASISNNEALKGTQIDYKKELFTDVATAKEHKIVGQLFSTYWIIEFKDKYYIIDQHAAHERVLYDKIIKGLKDKTAYSQKLLQPLIVHLSMKEKIRLDLHQHLFLEIGFEIEDFGGDAIAIRSVPYIFDRPMHPNDFVTILDRLDNEYKEEKYGILINEIASMACKAAVKAHDHMTSLEYQQLIDELLLLENPFNCPHGRPTIISMTKYELEKKFKRIQ
ncbi:MAG: DNA mismatch repair protein MutL [Firmicutes bacterium HGW-Firmicutes-1]|jgi:DNA mismatch repair protein MutL|nr:MAG: DNA mismatch repair protein MutL [Firmicutes bacterium HGW-Firmicutes-1]